MLFAYLPTWLLLALAFAAGVIVGPRVKAAAAGARAMASHKAAAA